MPIKGQYKIANAASREVSTIFAHSCNTRCRPEAIQQARIPGKLSHSEEGHAP
jgi:hypothetical protein